MVFILEYFKIISIRTTYCKYKNVVMAGGL